MKVKELPQATRSSWPSGTRGIKPGPRKVHSRRLVSLNDDVAFSIGLIWLGLQHARRQWDEAIVVVLVVGCEMDRVQVVSEGKQFET